MASKIQQKNNGFLDRFWKGSGPPKKARPRLFDSEVDLTSMMVFLVVMEWLLESFWMSWAAAGAPGAI